MSLEPIRKSLVVACDPEAAFRVFTEQMGTWWPLASHSLHGDDVMEVVWEGRVGGSVYERTLAGERADWATVRVWEPPTRLVIDWHVNPERAGTTVEVRFTAAREGTLVELEHRGFERLADGAEMRAGYETGWDDVLSPFPAALPEPPDDDADGS